jgi:hypothetical protein
MAEPFTKVPLLSRAGNPDTLQAWRAPKLIVDFDAPHSWGEYAELAEHLVAKARKALRGLARFRHCLKVGSHLGQLLAALFRLVFGDEVE